jgi:hypothetical protein
MGFLRNMMKGEERTFFNLFLVFCLTALIGLGCSSSGGGDDDDDDDDDDNGSTPSIVGVWKLKSVTEDCGDGNPDVTTLPYNYSDMVNVNAYVKISSNKTLYYAELSDVSPMFVSVEDGIYYCAAEEDTYTTNGNTVTNGDGTTATYSVSGNTLTLVSKDEENCTTTMVLEKTSDSALQGATENCAVFGLIDMS